VSKLEASSKKSLAALSTQPFNVVNSYPKCNSFGFKEDLVRCSEV
jgi:hypothetical protein